MTRTPLAHRLAAVAVGFGLCLGSATAAQAADCGSSMAFGRVQSTCEVAPAAAAAPIAQAAPISEAAPAAPVAARTATAVTERRIVADDGTVGHRPEGAVRQAAARRIGLVEAVMKWNMVAAKLR